MGKDLIREELAAWMASRGALCVFAGGLGVKFKEIIKEGESTWKRPRIGAERLIVRGSLRRGTGETVARTPEIGIMSLYSAAFALSQAPFCGALEKLGIDESQLHAYTSIMV